MLVDLIKLAKKHNVEVNFRFDDNARALTITMYDRENKYKSCHYISEDDLNYYEDSEAAEKFIMDCIINRIEENEKFIMESSRLVVFEAAKKAGCKPDGDYVCVNGYKYYVNIMRNEVVKVNEPKEDGLMRDANSLNTRKYMVEMADEKKVEE